MKSLFLLAGLIIASAVAVLVSFNASADKTVLRARVATLSAEKEAMDIQLGRVKTELASTRQEIEGLNYALRAAKRKQEQDARLMEAQEKTIDAYGRANERLAANQRRAGLDDLGIAARAEQQAQRLRAAEAPAARPAQTHTVELLVQGRVDHVDLWYNDGAMHSHSAMKIPLGGWSHSFEAKSGDYVAVSGTLPNMASPVTFTIKVDGNVVKEETATQSHEHRGVNLTLE